MRPNTITAHFLALCTLLSVEASKTSDIVRNPFALMNLMRVNTKLDNAKYNPDINLNTVSEFSLQSFLQLQMIRKAGYPAEAHVVLTEDGFLLTLHRIPGSKNSPPVLLQHGLLCSSADWVILGKDKGLAYMLADQGYDIWLGNFRGNTYSRAHISLSPSDAKFWDFSFHEMGMYDLPEMISFIMNKTSQPLHTYIAHSMGNSAFYVMATNRPDITEKIGATISLAPAIFVQHMKSPLHYFASLSYFIEKIAKFLGANEFLPQTDFLKFLAKYTCDDGLLKRNLCTNVIFLLVGFDKEQFNDTLLPVILNNSPAGASTKTIVHFLQEVNSGKFRPFDYGRSKNKQIYNATKPPDYNLSNITMPISLFYGDNDWLVDPADIKTLYNSLPNVQDIYRVPFSKFNHIDFVWAKDAPTLVYDKVLEIIKRKQISNKFKKKKRSQISNLTKIVSDNKKTYNTIG